MMKGWVLAGWPISELGDWCVVRLSLASGRARRLHVRKDAALSAGAENAASSLILVAGARSEAEKKTSANVLDFEFRREQLRIAARLEPVFIVTCLAA